MNEWKVIWFDGSSLRETVIPACDFYSLPSFASSYCVKLLRQHLRDNGGRAHCPVIKQLRDSDDLC